jgi:hypothetical protein
MYLDQNLVGTATGMSREPTYIAKNPPSTSTNEKFANCLTSTSCLAYFSFFADLLSTCSSFSKSLIMTNDALPSPGVKHT